MAEAKPAPVLDSDRDSLHILPLSILPLQTPGLQRARLIKNLHLNSVVEMFKHKETGSGQIDVSALPDEFGWREKNTHPDFFIMRKLALLPSYDVYSLRILLRNHGIEIEDVSALKLSEAKVKELSSYMTAFTHPLIERIYGGDGGDVAIQDFDDILALFRDPDVQKAREKLAAMAEMLNIRLEEIPGFLEDYGDIFLSLSYYRQCLDEISPVIDEFLDSLDEIRNNLQLQADPNLMKTCVMMQGTFRDMMIAIMGRFENFDRKTNDLWENLSAERFQDVRKLIQSYHTTIGGVLCALTVKMNGWHFAFPTRGAGGPMKRSEFIMQEMRQGVERIRSIEESAAVPA